MRRYLILCAIPARTPQRPKLTTPLLQPRLGPKYPNPPICSSIKGLIQSLFDGLWGILKGSWGVLVGCLRAPRVKLQLLVAFKELNLSYYNMDIYEIVWLLNYGVYQIVWFPNYGT